MRIGGKQLIPPAKILPPYVRRSQPLDEVLYILYLRSMSTTDLAVALTELLGEAIKGFSLASGLRL